MEGEEMSRERVVEDERLGKYLRSLSWDRQRLGLAAAEQKLQLQAGPQSVVQQYPLKT